MLEYKRECLYTLIYDYILLCECIQILIITIIIMEVQRDICGTNHILLKKKAIKEEIKVSTTREVPSKQRRRRFNQIFLRKKSTILRTL